MRKRIIDLMLFIVAMVYIIFFMVKIFNTDDNLIKHQIIKNSNKIHLGEKQFKIESYDSWYFTDATINLMSDSSYHVVLWGNRDSNWWWLLKDHTLSVDIPYNRYRNMDVTKDKIILEILHQKIKEKQEKEHFENEHIRINKMVDEYFENK